jgi:hypothetical protein
MLAGKNDEANQLDEEHQEMMPTFAGYEIIDYGSNNQ